MRIVDPESGSRKPSGGIRVYDNGPSSLETVKLSPPRGLECKECRAKGPILENGKCRACLMGPGRHGLALSHEERELRDAREAHAAALKAKQDEERAERARRRREEQAKWSIGMTPQGVGHRRTE